MVRRKSDAPGRLQEAAMALFAERGYDGVTVAEIAERAGMTKRSFFNHFTDKPEVMFASADALQARVLAALTEADTDSGPLDAAVQAFTRAAAPIEDYPELARARRAIIDSSPDLQERDLAKMAAMIAAVADALAGRGVPRRDAVFVAQAATTVFATAADEWAREPERGLAASIRDTLGGLRAALGTGERDVSLPGPPPA
jgi:AcrR family transcriptional regulator